MKNLLSIWNITKTFGFILVAGGITQNIITYNYTKEDISNAEKEGKEYAKDYCKQILKNSYKEKILLQLVSAMAFKFW